MNSKRFFRDLIGINITLNVEL